eukprot:209452_1
MSTIMKPTTMWYVGKNDSSECGIGNVISWDMDESNTTAKQLIELKLAKWSEDIQYLTNITSGYKFNIFTASLLKPNTYTVFGYVRNLQETLPYKSNHFYIIPTSIISICIQYYRHNYEYYSAGHNAYGQCCIDIKDDETIPLTKIENISANNISKICIGSFGYNIFWITNNGHLYFNGANDNFQLGVQSSKTSVYKPIFCNFLQENSLKCVDGVCAGNMTIMVCNNGSVWSSGHSSYVGAHGHGSLTEVFQFKQISVLNEYKIISVSAGDCFSMFVCDNGNVWSCGQNHYGQLGCGNSEICEKQVGKVEYFEVENIKIIQIVCGHDHSIALDVNGNVYGWGGNANGECGVGYDVDFMRDCGIHTPTKIDTLDGNVIVDIKCGSYHSGCIVKDGKYYIWGRNDYNQCMSNMQRDVATPNCINEYVCEVTNAANIIDMALGDGTTLILVE